MDSKVDLSLFDKKNGLNRGKFLFFEILWYLVKIVFFLSSFPFPSSFKVFLLRLFGAKVGKNVYLKPKINIHFPWKLIVGNNVWIGEEVFILNLEDVFIGNSVCLSQRSFVCTGNHNFRTIDMQYFNKPIIINDGCWIGASCFVGPGITLEPDTVLLTGSFLFSSTTFGSIYRGNPAIKIKNRW